MKWSKDTSKNVEAFYEIIEQLGLDSNEVVQLFCNWHGVQSFTEDFMQYVANEYELDNENESDKN